MQGLFKDSGIPTYEEMVKKLTLLNKIKCSLTQGRIVHLPGNGQGIFVGDLHGDLEAIISVVKQTEFLKAMKRGENMFLVFLGDYGDRGRKILETINAVISLKLMFPENVILLRGNHEEEDVAIAYGTCNEFLRNYGNKNGESLFDLFCSTMKALPVVAITVNGIIGVHGGIPNQDIKSIKVLNGKNGEQYAEEMTWNDPGSLIPERYQNRRGESCTIFGENAFNRFMEAVPAKIMVRSHEYPENGVFLHFGNRLATIFSNGSEKSESSHYRLRVRRPVFLRVDLGEEKSHFTPDDFIEVKY